MCSQQYQEIHGGWVKVILIELTQITNVNGLIGCKKKVVELKVKTNFEKKKKINRFERENFNVR